MATNPNWLQQVQGFGNLSNLPPELWAQLQNGQPAEYQGYRIEPLMQNTGSGGENNYTGQQQVSGYSVVPDSYSTDKGGNVGQPIAYFNAGGGYGGSQIKQGFNSADSFGTWLKLMAAGAAAGYGASALAGAGAGAGAGVSGATGGAGAGAAGFTGDATAAGYGGLNAAGAGSLGGGASLGGTAAGTAATGAATGAGAAGVGTGAATVGGAAGAGVAGTSASTAGLAGTGIAGTAALGAGGSGAGLLGGASQYLGPAAALVGGAISSNAARTAAQAQVDATNSASQVQRDIFNQQTQLQAPFREAGLTAQNKLLSLLGLGGDPSAAGYGSLTQSAPGMHDFTMADYQADPGYAFRLQQGERALNASAAARGGLLSGRAAKDLDTYSQGLASQEYGNAFDRFQTTQNTDFNRYQVNRSNILNPLQSLMGAGQSSTDQLTSAAGNYGNNVSNNLISAGNANASGIVGGANAYNNAIGSGWNAYQNNQLLSMLQRPVGTTAGGGASSYAAPSNATSNAQNYYSSDYGQYL